MQEGIEGPLRDKTRPLAHPAARGGRCGTRGALTQTDPPGEATNWICNHDGEGGRHQRQLGSTHLASARQPHRVRQFKLSNAPTVSVR